MFNHLKIIVVFLIIVSFIVNFFFVFKLNLNNNIIRDKDQLINDLEDEVSMYTGDIINLMDILIDSKLLLPEDYQQCRLQEPNEQHSHKIAYLTFDDGPSIYTKYFLDILKECDVKATFFVVGKNAERNQEVIIRMDEEGHVIGNHAYSHRLSSLYRTIDNFTKELDYTHDIIYNITGNEPNLFRFPGGSTMVSRKSFDSFVEVLYERGYYYFDWNVSTGDGYPQSTKKVIRNLERGIRDKNTVIILMHDIKKSTLVALPEIIRILREEGYRFATLSEHSYKAQHRETQ